MPLKLIVLISISTIFISCGVFGYKKSLSSSEGYNFIKDFKHTFITPHWRYSSHHNDGNQRRIVPVMMIIGGVGIMVVGLIRVL